MTLVKIKKQGKSIKSVESIGHTGYAAQGEDIVCAALSSIIQTALLGLLSVAAINVKYDRDDEDGYLKFELPDNITEEQAHDADVILTTMYMGIADLEESYSDYIKLEVK
ncbi:MAG TPA: ribosomal-processing cysteine protease Prp [Clostridia bacterium]